MIISKKNQMLILGVLIVLTLSFIWGNSVLPATKSQQISDTVKEVLEEILPEDFFEDSGVDDDTLVRKLAHYTEFTALGAEVTLLLWCVLDFSMTAPLLSGLLAAVTDETIQLFSQGRGSSVRDVWIDFGGVATGFVIVLLVQKFRSRRGRKRQSRNAFASNEKTLMKIKVKKRR